MPREPNEGRYDEKLAEVARQYVDKFCKKHGGQNKVAKMIGCNQGTLSKIIGGSRQPSLYVLVPMMLRSGHTMNDVFGMSKPHTTHDPELTAMVKALEEKVDRVERKFESVDKIQVRVVRKRPQNS